MPEQLDAAPFLDDCLAAGFALAGVAAATPPPHGEAVGQWIADGMHGSMGWMARHQDVRSDPALLLEGARSIICVADRYEPPEPTEQGGGRIAAYARGRDYHRVIRKRLHGLADRWRARCEGADFRVCVDTAPLLERPVAEAAGLGRVGKNTLLIDPGIGSWMLLGEVVTTLSIATTPGGGGDPCGTCTRCIDACPTQALSPWKLDARVCISALTIEHRETIPAAMHAGIGDWLFGCDVCQTVCPHNAPTLRTRQTPVHDEYAPRFTSWDVASVLDWGAEARLKTAAGTPTMRATLDMIRRNACIVAGGMVERQPGSPLASRLRAIASDAAEPEMVRDAAAAAITRADGGRAGR
ncbi:MAG: tRNA epoxyqueuosine(34) reductase QueG [Phycisphaerales bacterium]|jgi:epoxyqueuosine reductase|nr:tRNA epoxyqueuosine(34) reductase QueG [Phycisphaerales bacterium]